MDDISPSCDHRIPMTDRRDTRENCRAGNQRLLALEGHPQVVVQVQAMQRTRADTVPWVPYPLDLGWKWLQRTRLQIVSAPLGLQQLWCCISDSNRKSLRTDTTKGSAARCRRPNAFFIRLLPRLSACHRGAHKQQHSFVLLLQAGCRIAFLSGYTLNAQGQLLLFRMLLMTLEALRWKKKYNTIK